MSIGKTRYFRSKILHPGEFSQLLRLAISKYSPDPDNAHIDFVQWFDNDSSLSNETAKFDDLMGLCDLGSSYGLRIWAFSEFNINTNSYHSDRNYVGIHGQVDYFDIHIEAQNADHVKKLFDAIITTLGLVEIESPDKMRAPGITILFLAADPTDSTRLKLGTELREIQEKLIKQAKLREQFVLHQQMSARPTDISQALLDFQPNIVHFSGHGMASGELCFEDELGKRHPIQPDALAALFEQFTDHVNCVILNACFSESQANAIAMHINFVIGMSQAISDKAAIAFSVGFYQALGAGRSIEEAYKLGCVQIRLQGIPDYLIPILIQKR